ncbi:MAG: MarR family transcriptional regulator [Clostridiales bacterium]|nr:MarR family transcriptional regulator [Clostridiales bacterium]MDO4350797.1 MarR family winged helix-turn-helix transcriptional regulator [Eubacteriales bacterium]MDY4008877.1 MarR family winged helix-turn-helix transcriptional regulator [Candidatus Limiplasma sp.]
MDNRFETFTSLILQINRSIQRIKSLEMTEFDLRGVHAMCLFYLRRHPDGLTQGQLAKLCLEDKASVSRALAGLAARGLIVDTQPAMAKKYNAKILLTPEGASVAARVTEKAERALLTGAEGLDEAGRALLYRQLETINQNLERYVAEALAPIRRK